jgi:hypothetical protein
MSYLCCTSNLVVNEDQSATVTMDLCNVCYKAIQTYSPDPTEWVNDRVKNSIQYRADTIYKFQLEKHLTEGTMPTGATKESLVLSYEHDPSKPLPP